MNINKNIAVLGGSSAGILTALKIADAGYNVFLLGESGAKEEVKNLQNKNIEVFAESRLIDFDGFPGDFTLKFASGDKVVEKKAGAVIAATGLYSKPSNKGYCLDFSDKVISLSRAEKSSVSIFKNKTVGFLMGLASNSDYFQNKRVFSLIKKIQKQEKDARIFVLAGDLKVASYGLEELYLNTRQEGAVYVKLTKSPVIDMKDTFEITYFDENIRRDVSFTPDMIVVDEASCGAETNKTISEKLKIDIDKNLFLQTGNVHRLSVKTNREGIFTVGEARNISDTESSSIDADNALIEIEKLFSKKLDESGIKVKAEVDAKKCVICLTCYRSCPHGAVFWKESHAEINPAACQGCGICASECPMNAIQLIEYRDDFIENRIDESIKSKKDMRIIAFCCENSGFEAGKAAIEFNMNIPESVDMIKVPCAGKIDLEYIMDAFAKGADGVMVIACHTGNCKSERGNTFAKWRVNLAQQMLEEAGIRKDRLCFASVASNMASDFSMLVSAMEEKIMKEE